MAESSQKEHLARLKYMLQRIHAETVELHRLAANADSQLIEEPDSRGNSVTPDHRLNGKRSRRLAT